MCLDLNENTKLKIATKDIICYKRIKLFPTTSLTNWNLYHGKEFTGDIAGIKCSGVINSAPNCLTYFNTDNSRLGEHVLDYLVNSIIVDGKELVYSALHTPYQRTRIEIGNTYYSQLIREVSGSEQYKWYEVKIGLHSFKYKKAAINDGEGLIVKCIIPKGATYYVGEFGNDISYASDTLKYVEIIKK